MLDDVRGTVYWMSSETDHPRQRTVAELLAEHGEGGATGRRRRRRASDEPDEDGPEAPPAPTPPGYGSAPPAERLPELPRREPPSGDAASRGAALFGETPFGATSYQEPVFGEPDRSVLRDPVPSPPRSAAAAPGAPAPQPERPTDVMPRISAPVQAEPAPVFQPAPAPEQDHDEGGPSTMIGGAPVEAQDWHRVRTEEARRDGAAVDDGPFPPVPADDGPAGLGPVVDLEKHPHEPLDDADPRYEDESDVAPRSRERRLGRASAAAREAAAPAWAAVMGQWIAGALGGAVLWVLFRFLWRNLPVVALASAVVVTVGLVIVVRALLHNNDRRTTIFAVLVGLLLTVSPAILVLMGR